MSYLLRIGLALAIFFVLIGGILYLYQNGDNLINYGEFHVDSNRQISLLRLWYNAFTFSATGLILLGLFILLLTQVLRIALTAWLFVQLQDTIFAGISLIILAILIYSMFWR